MNRGFFCKLAWENLKKNRKDYIPYMLTCVGTIAMFYIIYALATAKSVEELPAGVTVKVFLIYGVAIVGIFAVIFLFYTNSFLIKRRKKEFGLFNILGMEKKHIARVILCETVFIALISFAGGIFLGIFLSKLILLLLLRLMDFHVVFGIEVSISGIIVSACLFGAIFLLIFLNAVRQIHLSNPVELLKGGQVGEKEPKSKWFIGILGFFCVGLGYVIANTVKSPVEAMFKFFIAVVLVIVGTYLVFGAGSILVLKALRKNKRFYYQANHFITVSGMIYRMKQNAVGLANICILSTMVLVMVSATVSMYMGIEDIVNTRYPASLSIQVKNMTQEQADDLFETVDKVVANEEVEENMYYRSYNLMATLQDGKIERFRELKDVTDIAAIVILDTQDYNRICGKKLELKQGQIGTYTLRGEKLEGELHYQDKSWEIAEQIEDVPVAGEYAVLLGDVYVLVMNEEEATEFVSTYYETSMETMDYYQEVALTDDTRENEERISGKVTEYLEGHGFSGNVEGREENRDVISQFYGGFLFLGIFLGTIFVMAAVLIIYYKQISEGYDDKGRFEIMKKVGMSEKEIRSSIRSQTLMVFFIPLAGACIHMMAGFGLIEKILALMNLSNTGMFIKGTAMTVLIFAVIYGLVYMGTAREYYRIVKQ